MSSGEASVWILKPQDVGDNDMRVFESVLDAGETERALKFRFEADRRAYVVAHGIRRVALGDLLDVNPVSLVISKEPDGQPLLKWPAERKISFSHAHSRAVVAFAMSSVNLVGVDVESMTHAPADLDLLTPYVVMPQVSQRIADLGPDPAGQFFFYWTALEAFWKSSGKGLSPGNPRIRCEKNEAGVFEIKLEGDVGARHPPRAIVSRIEAPKGCMISLAHQFPKGQLGRRCIPPVRIVGRSSKKGVFF